MPDTGATPCCLCRSDYARCRIELSAARLTVLAAAHALDKHGNKKARGQIAAAKVYAPNVVLRVIDAAIQVQDPNLAFGAVYHVACTCVDKQRWVKIATLMDGVALVTVCKPSCSCSALQLFWSKLNVRLYVQPVLTGLNMLFTRSNSLLG